MSDINAENLSPHLIDRYCASVMLACKSIVMSLPSLLLLFSEFGLPIPSHFSPSTFLISAFDNFDHMDKNMLSGKLGIHDTVITLF